MKTHSNLQNLEMDNALIWSSVILFSIAACFGLKYMKKRCQPPQQTSAEVMQAVREALFSGQHADARERDVRRRTPTPYPGELP